MKERTASSALPLAATRRRAEQSARPSPASEARPQRPTGAAGKFEAVAPLLGLVADTHGYFDPRLTERLRGVDHILHAGDIGDETVLEQLRQIAPVTAIRGNVDATSRYPATCVVLWGGLRIRLIHDVQEWTGEMRAMPVEVVVCGHSHVPLIQEEGGVVVVNPGSAGKKRFQLPRTCARLWREGGQIRVEHMSLEGKG